MKRYQIVYNLNDDNKVVFVGTTDLGIDDLLNSLDELFDVTVEFTIFSVMYEPIKEEDNGKEEKA